MMQEMLNNLQNIYENELDGNKILHQPYILLEGVKSKRYKPLLHRIKCSKCFFFLSAIYNINIESNFNILSIESLENRIAHYTKKRRIDIQLKSDECDNNDDTME